MNKELLAAILKALEMEITGYGANEQYDSGWNSGIRKAILIVKGQVEFLEQESFVYGR